MTWTYRQSTGDLAHNGAHVATGYSGHGEGFDNPADDATPREGPCPRGRYSIGEPHNSLKVGPFAMALTPLPGTDTHGRSAFLMHGDNRAANHTASHGCLIFSHPTRLLVARSGDHILEVVP